MVSSVFRAKNFKKGITGLMPFCLVTDDIWFQGIWGQDGRKYTAELDTWKKGDTVTAVVQVLDNYKVEVNNEYTFTGPNSTRMGVEYYRPARLSFMGMEYLSWHTAYIITHLG